MLLLWAVVTYLIKKSVAHANEHDIDSDYRVCIH